MDLIIQAKPSKPNTPKRFIKGIITNGSHEEQLNFLKVYPAFSLDYGILDIWIEIYFKILVAGNELVDFESVIKESSNIDSKEKTINFIKAGLKYGYLSLESSGHLKIIKLLESREDAKYVNSLKINLAKMQASVGRSVSILELRDVVADLDITSPRQILRVSFTRRFIL